MKIKNKYVLAILLMSSTAAFAAVPGFINFQGRLLDGNKLPRNGNFSITFNICALPTGGCLWTEDKTVAVANGVFAVQLGTTTALTPTVFSAADRYLEIIVGGEALTPREQLAVAPYSLRSSVADGLSGNDGSALLKISSIAVDGVYTNSIKDLAVTNEKLAGLILPVKLDVTAAGLGISSNAGTGALDINADGSSLEVNGDTLRVKALGVTNAMLAGSIAPAKITGTAAILGTNTFSGNQTLSDGYLLDLSGINNSAAAEGLRLPQATDVSAGTAEGQISWDTDDDTLHVGTGSGMRSIGIPNGIQSFTASGSWTRPAGVNRVYVQLWGGGGGGGTGASNASDGGGGGGAYCAGFVEVTAANATVTVGAAGTANGGAGGASSFQGVTTLTAAGGTGTTSNAGGAGGATPGGGCLIALAGQTGGVGLVATADSAGSGDGGNSPFGGAGGKGVPGSNATGTNLAGAAGQVPGGGGAGGKETGAGGAGALGLVIVMY